MATFLGSPSFLSLPLKRLHLSSSSQQPPRTPPPQLDPSSSSSSSSQQQQQLNSTSASTSPVQEAKPRTSTPVPSPDSTDWVASSLSRRFGLGAGLAWAAFLAVGVVSEQLKTRFEAYQEQAQTRDVVGEEEVVLPNGIRYVETRVGGGASPRRGDLVVIDLQGRVQGSGEVFVDTLGGEGKPLALVLGSRPYTRGMCEGVEYVLQHRMKAGGRARVVVPPGLGFGDRGADLGSGVQIPPNSTLEFLVQVDKVSIAPS